jgi:hypothetical protein
LGSDEIECVISETARGTSVGFYQVNALQGLLYTIPFLFPLLLHLLNLIDPISDYISGNKALLNIDLIKLFSGNSSLNFRFALIIIIVASLPFILEFYNQRLRLINLKSRFSFYSRDAIWETRELSPTLIALKAVKSAVSHGLLLAILYFAVFAIQDSTLDEITQLYRTDETALYIATSNAFTYTAGTVIGLLAADKALSLRRDAASIDTRNRVTGSLLERRIDPILYGIQTASYTGIIFSVLMSVTFLSPGTFDLAIQLMTFTILGGAIAGIIHQEGPIWLTSSYGILVFFTSLILIFRTGDQPEYAFAVILQLFIIPIPFILYLSLSFQGILKKNNITSREWIYDIFPLMAFYSLYLLKKRRRTAREAYERGLSDELPEVILDRKIPIVKDFLQVKDSNAYRLARHYFELLFSYSASFEEDRFILIPTATQLNLWWGEKSKQTSSPEHIKLIHYVDQMLWDPEFSPSDGELEQLEPLGKEMVLALQ